MIGVDSKCKQQATTTAPRCSDSTTLDVVPHNWNEAVAPSAFRTMLTSGNPAAFRSRADGRFPQASQERDKFRPSDCSGFNRRPRLPVMPIIPQFGFFERSRSQTMRIRQQPLEGCGQPSKTVHSNPDGSRNIEISLNRHARERIRLGPSHLHRNDSAEQRLAAIRVNGVQVFRFAGQLAGDPS